ncbi:ATP-binding protein [Desulfobaculum sp. SPO524]|uniref:ATP-binding protein n=1 Tax=Desulfobaculum sp. SPO524 TaxID=3378071 RepID=UPI0038541A46
MRKIIRKIIEIDESLCDGCGQCIPSCAEGALAIVDGKAKVVKDMYCDGLGACLGECPQDALRIVEREADPFDEEAAMAHVARTKEQESPLACGCPGSAMQTLKPAGGCPGAALQHMTPSSAAPASADTPESQLSHWPVQIRLVPPHAPFLNDADLVVAADCAPVAMPNFHDRYVRGKVVLIGCPKFDDAQYAQRFAEIFSTARVRSVTVVRMEVPCCQGLPRAVKDGIAMSGSGVTYNEVTVTRTGDVIEST